MNTPDTLCILRARLIEMTRQLSLAMSEVGGMVRIIDECDGREHGDTRDTRDHGETRDARDAGRSMVGRGVYRGIAVDYSPARIMPTTVDDPKPPDDEPRDHAWRERLVYDFEVSDVSPVIKDTWVTVSHIVGLIVDGHSWSDILRMHPELTEDDIRVALSYSVAESNDEVSKLEIDE